VSFKGVVLEGLEVAFIAVTFGSNQHNVALAALAAVAAVVLLVATGRRRARAAQPGVFDPSIHTNVCLIFAAAPGNRSRVAMDGR
jgi:hypothetical protein